MSSQENDVAGVRRLIDSRRLYERLGVSRTTGERLKAARRLPRHIELTRSTHRWDADEVERWIGAGCPVQELWEGQKKAAGREARRG